MRHSYRTDALVLARLPHGEASATVFLLTSEFGLLRARAQGLRKSGAKLASALQTLCESDVTLVRGKDTWRLSGARLIQTWMPLDRDARARAGRVAQLLIRLTHGEAQEGSAYPIMQGFLTALQERTPSERDAAECLAALRLLRSMGLDAGEIPGTDDAYDTATLAAIMASRQHFVQRVNRGIHASGL